jgi:hypothetical protein
LDRASAGAPCAANRSGRLGRQEIDYKAQDGEAPEQGSAPDLTHMTAGTATSLNPFGDAMEVRKPRVIYIDNREKQVG